MAALAIEKIATPIMISSSVHPDRLELRLINIILESIAPHEGG